MNSKERRGNSWYQKDKEEEEEEVEEEEEEEEILKPDCWTYGLIL